MDLFHWSETPGCPHTTLKLQKKKKKDFIALQINPQDIRSHHFSCSVEPSCRPWVFRTGFLWFLGGLLSQRWTSSGFLKPVKGVKGMIAAPIVPQVSVPFIQCVVQTFYRVCAALFIRQLLLRGDRLETRAQESPLWSCMKSSS